MRRVVISQNVVDKVLEIHDYLHYDLKLSEQAADKYCTRLIDFMGGFSADYDSPLCRAKRWRELGYRCRPFEKKWVVAYEIACDGIVIRDMAHGTVLWDV